VFFLLVILCVARVKRGLTRIMGSDGNQDGTGWDGKRTHGGEGVLGAGAKVCCLLAR